MNMIIDKIEFGVIPKFNTFERIDILNEMLNTGFCRVNFTKINGENREIICTLNSNYIPQEYMPKQNTTKKTPSETGTFTAYSVKDGWRSFKVDNVISIESCAPNEA